MRARSFDMILADPPYGDTSLDWDKHVAGWLDVAYGSLKHTGSMWVFGSMRFFMRFGAEFRQAGFVMAQDVVWEKHNGSGFAADRFKRVHEHIVQFYRRPSNWADVYNDVQKTADATKRTVRRKQLPPHHLGARGPSTYASEDGGPRLMRSVIEMRSMHGRAIHPTEKPASLIEILVRTSCPRGGVVGDFFAGSGACGEACIRASRDYVGCEVDVDMAEKARARISGVLL